MKRFRLVAITLLVIAVAAVAAAFGVRWYASTQVVPALAQQYGGKVEADSASAGWTQVTLTGVRFYEADGQSVAANVGHMTMDLSLLDLVRGKTVPEHLRVERPEVHLRFDENNKLLTKLPQQKTTGGPLPAE